MNPLITALRDPVRYPHPVRAVWLVETHISWLLLAGRFVYKLKKPVNLGFLDFSTLAARRHFCDEELRLNRRLAPQLYLEVVPIGGTPDAPLLGAEPAFEYAVKMRRFPTTRLMDKWLTAGKLTPAHIDALAQTVADFHAAAPLATGEEYGSAEAALAAVSHNFTTIDGLDAADAALLATVRAATLAEYARCQPLFAQRQQQGRVRECHGDLHLGNIVLLGETPVPFDCIEFNPAFRWIDVLSEIAFTLMDLLYRGQAALGYRLLNSYLERSGDYAGLPLLRFYLAYRATVRAKVTAIRAGQACGRSRAHERQAVHDYLALARDCLHSRHPAIILTHGLPGSGKSTFAQMAVERLGAVRIRSDVERKRLSPGAEAATLYSAEATQRTYARLAESVRHSVAAGYPVIVDAAFLQRAERQFFQALAAELAVPFAIADVQVSDDFAVARITQRQAEGRDASDADVAVLHKLRAVQQPFTADELPDVLRFDNDSLETLAGSASWARLQALK